MVLQAPSVVVGVGTLDENVATRDFGDDDALGTGWVPIVDSPASVSVLSQREPALPLAYVGSSDI